MKRIVICSDGTTNDPRANTNVSKMVKVLANSAAGQPDQVVFYDPGVGTGRSLWNKITGGAVGSGLDKNVKDCYGFLIDNYIPGDELFLFGYSRGAFTARSLPGLIRCCGLPRVEHREQINRAYDVYRERHEQGADKPSALEFRDKFSHTPHRVPIRFLGVWDTVGALGIPGVHPLGWLSRRRHGFHDVKLSSSVQTARHALAIDERRKPFKPQVWQVSQEALESKDAAAREEGDEDSEWLKQVWFAGTHSQIGGGVTRARIAFRWMCAEAEDAGLQFNANALGAYKPDELSSVSKSPKPPYNVMGPWNRAIAAEPPQGFVTNEEVDGTAWRLWNEVPTYRPKTLAAYGRDAGLLDASGAFANAQAEDDA